MNTHLECRTCLGQFENDEVVGIGTKVADQKNILEAIEEVASIEVYQSDILPQHICQNCLRLLESALVFRKQIISSHLELKKRYHPEVYDPLFINCDEKYPKSKLDLQLNNEVDRGKNEKPEEDSDGEEKLAVKKENEVPDKSQKVNGDLKTDEDDIGPKSDSGSDWNDFNDENNSSEDCFEEKPNKKSFSKATSKKLCKNRRKKNILKKMLIDLSDTSSNGSDSDIPLEKLRKDIKDLGKKAKPKIRKKREKRDNADGPRLCPICGKLFKARQNFNSHMTTVHRKKPEKPDKTSCLCPDCGRVITGTRQNFVAHRRYHHSDKAQVKKRFTCDVCPRKFYREKNLIIHQKIHKGEKGYVCELCPDKSYTQIGGLILHRRKVHLKKPTCTCNYCGKQFYEKHYLETHIRQWHTGERPFSCEICGKAFSCNGTLLRHRKDSHGEKQPCPKCGKMYTEGELRKHLKRHKIREEGIKRKKYTCEYCGTEMNFTSRKRHLLKQHGIMLRGRGENAERVPITRADAM